MYNFKPIWEISVKIAFNLKKHDAANETVAEQVYVENIASQLHNNNFLQLHMMNKRQWRNTEKLKIVQIEKRGRKIKNFMKRIKPRWDIENGKVEKNEQTLS